MSDQHLKLPSKLDFSTLAAFNKTNQMLDLTAEKNGEVSRLSALDVSK